MNRRDAPPLVFLGSVVPDEEQYRSAAFSRAGNSAQTGLIENLRLAGRAPERVISFQPMPSFPHSRQWRVPMQRTWVAGCDTVLSPYINLPIIKPLSLALSLYRELRRVAGNRRVTLLSYNFNSFLALPMMALRRNGGQVVPILYDVDMPGQTVPDTLARRLDFRLLRGFLPRVAGAVVITEQVAKDFLPHQPALVVEGGLSAQQAEHHVDARLPPPGTFNIVYAGALERYNGIDVILDAVAGLPDPDVRLHVAGRGSLESEVRAAAQCDSRVIVHGYMDAAGLAQLYRDASLLINHRSDHRIDSRYVFPSKLIEYLASGIPVISTHFRSLKAEYRPYLTLLDDESPGALRQAIQTLRNAPEPAWNRAAEAQQFVLGNKTWREQARRITHFLEVIE